MSHSEIFHLGNVSLPCPQQSEILLDFDGTITRVDVLDELIARFAVNDSWKEFERQWQAGQIGSRECLAKEFESIRATRKNLDAFLMEIELDPGVERLFHVLSEYRIPVTIVSDGVDIFIKRLLTRLDPKIIPKGLVIRANAIRHHGDKIELRFPHANSACEVAAAHCKCHSAAFRHHSGRHAIYIGDGLSDICPAHKAPAIFAKSRLAEILSHQGISHLPFSTLDDVATTLCRAWAARSRKDIHQCVCRRE